MRCVVGCGCPFPPWRTIGAILSLRTTEPGVSGFAMSTGFRKVVGRGPHRHRPPHPVKTPSSDPRQTSPHCAHHDLLRLSTHTPAHRGPRHGPRSGPVRHRCARRMGTQPAPEQGTVAVASAATSNCPETASKRHHGPDHRRTHVKRKTRTLGFSGGEPRQRPGGMFHVKQRPTQRVSDKSWSRSLIGDVCMRTVFGTDHSGPTDCRQDTLREGKELACVPQVS